MPRWIWPSRSATPSGRPIDVTIDLLWGAPALAAVRAAAARARHVQLGQLAALTVELPAPVVRAAPLELRGFAISTSRSRVAAPPIASWRVT
jgi:hypothetical protein